MPITRLLALGATLSCLLACGNIHYDTPVNDTQNAQKDLDRLLSKVHLHRKADSRAKRHFHRVRMGETLYSIARHYQVDYRQLAQRNNIFAPYTIYPGQELQLFKRQQAKSSPTKAAKKPVHAVTHQAKKSVKHSPWMWPVKGRVVKKFLQTGVAKPNNGIDIAVKSGSPVIAAKEGTVVYQGTGLVGFGKVIIVKHSETYLSAYTHNHQLHVQEGDKVDQGQVIGTVGNRAGGEVILHFEVRKNGRPIDPLSVLSP